MAFVEANCAAVFCAKVGVPVVLVTFIEAELTPDESKAIAIGAPEPPVEGTTVKLATAAAVIPVGATRAVTGKVIPK